MQKKEKGIIQLVVLIIVALTILKIVWGIGLEDVIVFLNKPHIKELWTSLWDFIKMVFGFIKRLITKEA